MKGDRSTRLPCYSQYLPGMVAPSKRLKPYRNRTRSGCFHFPGTRFHHSTLRFGSVRRNDEHWLCLPVPKLKSQKHWCSTYREEEALHSHPCARLLRTLLRGGGYEYPFPAE